jgi:hypothetical protein
MEDNQMLPLMASESSESVYVDPTGSIFKLFVCVCTDKYYHGTASLTNYLVVYH